jgi:hypothetical protein
VTFNDSSSPQTNAGFSAPGVYTLRLAADDGLLLGSDDVIVEVLENQAPAVEAGPPRTVLLPATADLAGSVVDDGLPDDVLTIEWTKVSGPGKVVFSDSSAPATVASFSDTGSYLLRLTADDGMTQSTDEVTVVVIRNYGPSVDAGPDQIVEFPNTVSLSGMVSDDGWPDGTLTIEWSVVGTPPGSAIFDDASAPVTTVTFSEPGSYTLRLSADDGELQNYDEVEIQLQANQAPTVDAGADRNAPLNVPTLLDGRVEDDGLPDGTLIVAWSQVDGPGTVEFEDATAAGTNATFPELGDYTLLLSADDGALQASDEVVITVVDDDNLPPTVDAGVNQIVIQGEAATLSGTAEDDGLPNGVLTTTWSLKEGPGTVDFADPYALQTSVTFSGKGFYTLRLTADDGALQAYDDVIVTVQKDPGNPADNNPTATGCDCHTGATGTRIPWIFMTLLLCALLRGSRRSR